MEAEWLARVVVQSVWACGGHLCWTCQHWETGVHEVSLSPPHPPRDGLTTSASCKSALGPSEADRSGELSGMAVEDLRIREHQLEQCWSIN